MRTRIGCLLLLSVTFVACSDDKKTGEDVDPIQAADASLPEPHDAGVVLDGSLIEIPELPTLDGGKEVDPPRQEDAEAELPEVEDAAVEACDISDFELPAHDGRTGFSEAQFAACREVCEGKGDACYVEANCPGITPFLECISHDLQTCSAGPDGQCGAQMGAALCCVEASGKAACGDEIAAAQTCVSADQACNESLDPFDCLSPESEVDAGAEEACEGAADYPSYPDWTGGPGWTAAVWNACAKACEGAGDNDAFVACAATKCPAGAEDMLACFSESFAACSTSPGQSCRAAWESLNCCTDQKCAGGAEGCAASKCGAELSAAQACIDAGVASQDDPCLGAMSSTCFSPPGADEAGTIVSSIARLVQRRGLSAGF